MRKSTRLFERNTMVLSDISPGSSVELTAIIGSQKLVFKTETLGFSNDDKKLNRLLHKATGGFPYMVVPALTQNDKVIGFPTSGVVYQLIVVNKSDNKVYQWHTISIRQIKLPDQPPLHFFMSNRSGKEYNRREHYRLWLGCDGIANIGLHKTTFDVQVKDISATGVSFIIRDSLLTEKNIQVHEKDVVVLTFFDEASGSNFRLSALIVRGVKVDELRTLYGCKFAEENRLVGQFVTKRQRENLQKQRGTIKTSASISRR